METVRAMCERLANPMWMANPSTWTWDSPEGRRQGFGATWREAPGRANLMWLAMDLYTPPPVYNAMINPLLTLLVLEGGTTQLHHQPLLDLAGILPLKDFCSLLPEQQRSGTRLERALPLLRHMALKRIEHAHP